MESKKEESPLPMEDATDKLMLAVFDDIIGDIDTGTLTPKTTINELELIGFPELSEFDLTEYTALESAPRYDPSEDKIVGEPEQLSARRRSELKRLTDNGWIRDEVDNKRRRFTYKSPDKLTTVTSLKQAMKTISLAQIIDKADDKTITDTLNESAIA